VDPAIRGAAAIGHRTYGKDLRSIHSAVFLKTLKEARERAGVTQVQLAERLGETRTFVSKCERGERRVDVMELRMFCQAFGLSLKQFVGALEKAIAKGR
jgi:transcriptional regulator with XRE-family HTH domain